MSALLEKLKTSKGKWTSGENEISDVSFTVLSNAAKNEETALASELDFEAILNEKFEPMPRKKGLKLRWLKCEICAVLDDPKVEEQLGGTPPDLIRQKVVDFISKKLQDLLGQQLISKVIVTIVVFLLKRAINKGAEKLCANC